MDILRRNLSTVHTQVNHTWVYCGITKKGAKMKLTIHNTNKPCLWEEGVGELFIGHAVIIAGRNGETLNAVLINKNDWTIPIKNHALIPVTVGCYIIEAACHPLDLSAHTYWYNKASPRVKALVRVHQIIAVDINTAEAETLEINKFIGGKWAKPLAPNLDNAVEAAINKATCYRCSKPHYIKRKRGCCQRQRVTEKLIIERLI